MKSKWILATVSGLVVAGAIAIRLSHAQTDQSTYKNEVQIETRDGYREITSNGIPDHKTGEFPNRGNPNTIRPQDYDFRMTLTPERAKQVTPLVMGRFGVVLNGVPFDPGTAGWWDNDPNSGWHIAAHAGTRDLGLDYSNAHVQPNGGDHYHGLPYGWLANQPAWNKKQMTLTGWAADGFPIYSLYGYKDAKDAQSPIVELHSSYRLKQGTRPNGPGGTYDGTYEEDYEYVAAADGLDECNGRFGVTPEFPQGTYYYVLTTEYPYVPRCFSGTPDSSFGHIAGGRNQAGQNGRGPVRRPPGPPPPFGPPPPPPRF